jgi:SWI/SNF-related matrix-associated actin-dependent regulator 1 of chromatin subfamily A
MIRMIFHPDGNYYARCEFGERAVLMDAGFKWDNTRKCWFTRDKYVASKMVEFCTMPEVVADLTKFKEIYAQSFEHKNVWGFKLPVPETAPGEYREYQLVGIKWATDRRFTLIGDEMGLGKTSQAIGTAVVLGCESVLVICPALVKENWANEIKMWDPDKPKVRVLYGSKQAAIPANTFSEGYVVVNYDLIRTERVRDALKTRKWDLVIFDEMHMLKNPSAKRTKMILGKDGLVTRKDRIVALSGTPILNRPMEFHTVLSTLAPESIFPYTGKDAFARQYCGGFYDQNGELVSKGGGNLEELNVKLRSTVMIRRLKKDVEKELPEKTIQIIEVQPDSKTLNAIRQESSMVDLSSMREAGVRYLKEFTKNGLPPMDELARLRKEMMEYKLPFCVEHIHEVLESSEGKLGIFAHHRWVVEALEKEFAAYKPLVITGSTAVQTRQSIVDTFQTDPSRRLFIGNIKAAGVGITLTAASHCVFVEVTWTPGEILQAIDRFHRIGQKNPVLAQFIVLKQSVDEHMIRMIADKQKTLNKVLDTNINRKEPLHA